MLQWIRYPHNMRTTIGGSLRNVQLLAGHRELSTTQRCIEADVDSTEKRY